MTMIGRRRLAARVKTRGEPRVCELRGKSKNTASPGRDTNAGGHKKLKGIREWNPRKGIKAKIKDNGLQD